jgi:tryptophanyl-tRNA synthetase
MGKSEGEGNAVFLNDAPDIIRKKVMRAVTDAGPTEKNQKKPDVIENIFTLMKIVSSGETVKFFEEQYNNCTIRYGDMKKQLADDMVSFVAPIAEKIKSAETDDALLKKVIKLGKEKATLSADKTMKEVRSIIGFFS